MNFALRGIRSAHTKLEGAANTVQRASFTPYNRDTVDVSGAARELAAGDTEPSLVRGMVDMRMARYALAANVAVAQTVDEMMESAVEIGAPRRRFR